MTWPFADCADSARLLGNEALGAPPFLAGESSNEVGTLGYKPDFPESASLGRHGDVRCRVGPVRAGMGN